MSSGGGQEGGRYLVAFTVVLQTARPLAVAALAVSAVRLALLPLADLGLESAGIAVQTRLGKIRKVDRIKKIGMATHIEMEGNVGLELSIRAMQLVI